MFIAAVLSILAIARRVYLPATIEQRALPVATYAIGTMAAFWFIERLAVFFT